MHLHLFFYILGNIDFLVYKNAPRGNTLVRKEGTMSLALGEGVFLKENTFLFSANLTNSSKRLSTVGEGLRTLPYIIRLIGQAWKPDPTTNRNISNKTKT